MASENFAERALLTGNMPKLDRGDVNTDPLSYLYTVLKTAKAIIDADPDNEITKKLVQNELYYFKKALSVLGNGDAKFAQLRMRYPFTVMGVRELADKLQEFHKDKVLERQMIQAAGKHISSGQLQANSYWSGESGSGLASEPVEVADAE